MGLIASIYKSGLGDCSNDGVSAHYDKVCIVNVPGPFKPTDDMPAVRLVKREHVGNVVCIPVGLEGKWTMFGGCYVETSDSRFHEAVRQLSGYKFGFPVALHDRVE